MLTNKNNMCYTEEHKRYIYCFVITVTLYIVIERGAYMGKLSGRMLGILIITGFITGMFFCCQSISLAAETALFSYHTSKGREGETEQFPDAFDMCRKYGGTMVIQRDFYLNPEDYDDFIYIPDNVTIVVSDEVYFTLGDLELWLEGTIEVMGTLNVSDSEAMVSGSGNIVVGGEGCIRRRIPYVEKEGKICLKGSDIERGQSLSQSMIQDDQINWHTDVSGEWSFSQPDMIPEAGTGFYDVIFTPANLWIYQPVVLSSCGQVTVRGKTVSSESTSDRDNIIKDSETEKTQSDRGSTDVEKQGGMTVVVTRMVSKPSSIYYVVKKFSHKKPRIQTIKKKRKGRYVKWTAIVGKKGYEIQYSIYRSMKKAKKIKIRKSSTVIRISNKKTYYFRVRAYKEKNKKRTYTKWSSIKRG